VDECEPLPDTNSVVVCDTGTDAATAAVSDDGSMGPGITVMFPGVAAQVEFEHKVRKQFIIFKGSTFKGITFKGIIFNNSMASRAETKRGQSAVNLGSTCTPVPRGDTGDGDRGAAEQQLDLVGPRQLDRVQHHRVAPQVEIESKV